MYLHLYFSPERALEDETAFNNRMAQLQNELESGQRHPDHEKQYVKYFEVKITPVRGTKVIANDEAMEEAKRNYGYFALLSNDVKNAVGALEIYRNKDMVEKAFCNLKWGRVEFYGQPTKLKAYIKMIFPWQPKRTQWSNFDSSADSPQGC